MSSRRLYYTCQLSSAHSSNNRVGRFGLINRKSAALFSKNIAILRWKAIVCVTRTIVFHRNITGHRNSAIFTEKGQENDARPSSVSPSPRERGTYHRGHSCRTATPFTPRCALRCRIFAIDRAAIFEISIFSRRAIAINTPIDITPHLLSVENEPRAEINIGSVENNDAWSSRLDRSILRSRVKTVNPQFHRDWPIATVVYFLTEGPLLNRSRTCYALPRGSQFRTPGVGDEFRFNGAMDGC